MRRHSTKNTTSFFIASTLIAGQMLLVVPAPWALAQDGPDLGNAPAATPAPSDLFLQPGDSVSAGSNIANLFNTASGIGGAGCAGGGGILGSIIGAAGSALDFATAGLDSITSGFDSLFGGGGSAASNITWNTPGGGGSTASNITWNTPGADPLGMNGAPYLSDGIVPTGAFPAGGSTAGSVGAGAAGAALMVPTVDVAAIAAIGINTATVNASIQAGNAINARTAQAMTALEVKECVLDGIGFAIAQVALDAITGSIVDWINSGFKGNPAFVDDLGAFMGYVDVEAFEAFLGSETIANLCSPWKNDIRFALESAFVGGGRPECSLGDVVDNIEDFIAGDFQQGGWVGWFHLTQRNNPYTDFLNASYELDANIAGKREQERELLRFGRGFLSMEQCTERPATPGDRNSRAFLGPGGTVTDCTITTPGAVIETQLNETLGTGQRRLEVADEVNEIITAFLGQLVNQVFAQGLTSISASDFSSRSRSGRSSSRSSSGRGVAPSSTTIQDAFRVEQVALVASAAPLIRDDFGFSNVDDYRDGIAKVRSLAQVSSDQHALLFWKKGRAEQWEYHRKGTPTRVMLHAPQIEAILVQNPDELRVMHTHSSFAVGDFAPPSFQDFMIYSAQRARLSRNVSTDITWEVVDAGGVWRFTFGSDLETRMNELTALLGRSSNYNAVNNALDTNARYANLKYIALMEAARAKAIANRATNPTNYKAATNAYLAAWRAAGATITYTPLQ